MALIAQGNFTIKRIAENYELVISDKLVKKTSAGALIPSSVSARAYKSIGNSREEISNATIKLYGGNGDIAYSYSAGTSYSIKSTDKLLRWELIVSNTQVANDNTLIVSDGDKGDIGLSGAILRPRGEWAARTQYLNDTRYRDTVIYNKNKYIAKTTHTSGSSFVSSQWEDFNEFINVATQVLLADKAWIDILGTQGIAVGDDVNKRWLLTGSCIKHTGTNLELTPDGTIKSPSGGIVFTNGKTIEQTIQGAVEVLPGRNLVRYTNTPPQSDYWKGGGWSNIPPYYDSIERCIVLSAKNGWQNSYCQLTKFVDSCIVRFFARVIKSGEGTLHSCSITNTAAYGSLVRFYPTSEWTEFVFNVPLKGNIFAIMLQGTDNSGQLYEVQIKELKVEVGITHTDYSSAPEDTDYLHEAMQGDTTIQGGLMMSNVVSVRNSNGTGESEIVAGMSGLKDDGVAFFADARNAYRKAVNYFKGTSTDKPLFAVSKGGFFVAMSGLIGCFQIAKDLITIKDKSGADKVKFTGESIDNFASQSQSSTGGSNGSSWSASVSGTSASSTITRTLLTHTFTNNGDSVFNINIKQKEVLSTSVTDATVINNTGAYAKVNVNVFVRLSTGSTIINEIHLNDINHYCLTANMDILGKGNYNQSTNLDINSSFSEKLPKGSIKAEVIATINYDLMSQYDVMGAYPTSARTSLAPSGGVFSFISTDDETIFGSDGMSIRVNSNKFFKLLKQAGEISLIFRGLVSPDSNIPALICGGEVDINGVIKYKLGDDSGCSRPSTGKYRITLPSYMSGKSNYIVQLTGVSCDNMITLNSRNTSSNYFEVYSWNSPGNLENAAFSFMVYRAQ